MNLTPQNCPVCDRPTPVQQWAGAHWDLSGLGPLAFSSRKPPEGMHFHLDRCCECDVVFANPAPATDWLLAQYQQAAFAAGGESLLAARSYAHQVAGLMPRMTSKSGVLDIGAGDGAFLQELLNLGFSNVSGIEPSQAPIDQASAVIRPLLKNQMFTGEEAQPASLCLVTCFQTLEHVSRPLELCRKAFALLRPGGVLLVAAHDYRSWSARLLGRRSPIYDIQHLQLFSPLSLGRLLENTGLTEVSIRPLCNRYPLSYWLRLLPLGHAAKGRVLSLVTHLGLDKRTLSLCPGNLVAFGLKSLHESDGCDHS